MRNQRPTDYIYSYTALERAIETATRRYFLARNPAFAKAADEVSQSRQDNRFSPGFFHGETGNLRALNVLMQLQQLPTDKQNPEYENQLLLILFAIIDPISGSMDRSAWLATLLADTLIQGDFSAFSGYGRIVKRNTLSSTVFHKDIIDIAASYSLDIDIREMPVKESCNKLFALCVILRCLYKNFSREEKKLFNLQLDELKQVLTRRNKIDVTEDALSIKMR